VIGSDAESLLRWCTYVPRFHTIGTTSLESLIIPHFDLESSSHIVGHISAGCKSCISLGAERVIRNSRLQGFLPVDDLARVVSPPCTIMFIIERSLIGHNYQSGKTGDI
jgi:hypothetical protein